MRGALLSVGTTFRLVLINEFSHVRDSGTVISQGAALQNVTFV